MKFLLSLLLTIGCCLQLQLASAQVAELEQLALNIEKLAQLKSILSNMKKGYDLVSKGYTKIKDITEGNFKIHEVFLDGLMAVNPKIAKYSKVPAIIDNQINILNEYRNTWNRIRQGGRFTPNELSYISKVYSNLFNRSMENIDELTMVITASQLRMTDDERLRAIDRLHEEMQHKLSFLRAFNKNASLIDNQRKKALEDIGEIRSIYAQ
ncbi:TerB family tellurite resistance protein [Chitinophaga sp. RCC_12]|uniref:TerB family tellurite resistance protein n=1 Tax=Chitinophaga sp. RCC_12 TaxID=3239226 RepID=UPI003525D42A